MAIHKPQLYLFHQKGRSSTPTLVDGDLMPTAFQVSHAYTYGSVLKRFPMCFPMCFPSYPEALQSFCSFDLSLLWIAEIAPCTSKHRRLLGRRLHRVQREEGIPGEARVDKWSPVATKGRPWSSAKLVLVAMLDLLKEIIVRVDLCLI